MRHSTQLNHRFALLTALGLMHGCGGRSQAEHSREDVGTDDARLDASAEASADDRNRDDTDRDDADDDRDDTDRDDADDDRDDTDRDDTDRDDTDDDRDDTDRDDTDDDRDDTDRDDDRVDDDGGNDDDRVDAGALDASAADASRPSLPPQPPVAEECSGAQVPLGSGLQQCASGLVHRVAQPSCQVELPRVRNFTDGIPAGALGDAGVPEVPFTTSYDGVNYAFECANDSDCQERDFGMCEQSSSEASNDVVAACRYGCAADDDCPTGNVCECASPAGQCRPADCATSADCAAGELCARYQYDDGCGPAAGYACTTPSDECREDADCGEGYCKPRDGRRVCEFDECVIGRPFLVEGQVRLASAARRDDWLSDAVPEPMQPTSARARSEITEHWVRIGLMEHASIAAFARFSLQLLAFGAPASLLEATQRAMADETQHARLAFDLATRFGRVPCGPGYLDVSSALGASDWSDVVKTTFVEGCIGETVAAMEAAEALQHARDPQVRATLKVIARDERRHAELAWQFIDWALSQTPQLATELSNLVHDEQAEASRRAGECAPAMRRLTSNASSDERAKLAHGVVPEELSAQLRLSVLQTVVAPCAEALLKRVRARALDEAKSA